MKFKINGCVHLDSKQFDFVYVLGHQERGVEDHTYSLNLVEQTNCSSNMEVEANCSKKMVSQQTEGTKNRFLVFSKLSLTYTRHKNAANMTLCKILQRF